jgi:hypothetical protein
MQRWLFSSTKLDRRSCVGAATYVGNGLRTVPTRAGEVPVVYVHKQSPSEE